MSSVETGTSNRLSKELYQKACQLLPGGVNSPVRAFKAVSGDPVFFKSAKGSRLYDVDGNEYIDYVASWGAILLGHANESVTEAIANAASQGTSFGAPHEGEILAAKAVLERVPGLERVRFVNSGTEASMAAIRLARAATSRNKVIKFEGNYHGAVDSLLTKAGSGVATFGLPDSAGIPNEITQHTLLAKYNDLDNVRETFVQNKGEVAAVLVEPVAGNMGCVPPAPGFLKGLRALCDEFGALLVFDEVMTGFRIARGGAAERYEIKPDLFCMGKVIGGGLPVGAYGGRKDLMDMIAPLGPVYQAGTLSGNPLAMAAGYAALSQLTSDSYDYLETIGSRLQKGLNLALESTNVEGQVQRVGSMISVYFTSMQVTDFSEAQETDKALYSRLFHALLSKGVYLPPSALETWFFTTAHTEEDIDRTVDAFGEALQEAKQ